MARGPLTRRTDGPLTRSPRGAPDPESGARSNRPPRPSRPEAAPSFEQALDEFLLAGRARGLSPKTLDWYQMVGRRFSRIQAERGADPAIGAVTTAQARAFVVELQDSGLSPVSVAGFVRGLKVIFGWCAAEGLTDDNPLRRLPGPRVPQRLVPTLSQDQLSRLLGAASARDRLLITILLDTGLRVSELADLRLDDLIAEGFLRVRGKGSKERLVPLGSVTHRRLGEYVAHDRPRPVAAFVDHLFLARDGRPMTAVAVKHAFRRIGARAGLADIRTNPHTFRHTFAKLYLVNGGDLFSLQRILGHTTLDMVRRYVDLDAGDVKRIHVQASPVDRLAAASRDFARA
jgi:site-specific recombinase XerD